MCSLTFYVVDRVSRSRSHLSLSHTDSHRHVCAIFLGPSTAPVRPYERCEFKARPNLESLSPGCWVACSPLFLVISSTHYNATAASLLLLATAAPPNHAHVISTLLARSQPSPPPAGSACPRSLRNGSANVRQLNTHGPRARPRFDAQPRTVCKEELRWQTDGREDLVEQQPLSGRPPLWRAVRPLAQRGYLLILRGHVSS